MSFQSCYITLSSKTLVSNQLCFLKPNERIIYSNKGNCDIRAYFSSSYNMGHIYYFFLSWCTEQYCCINIFMHCAPRYNLHIHTFEEYWAEKVCSFVCTTSYIYWHSLFGYMKKHNQSLKQGTAQSAAHQLNRYVS